MTVRRSYDGGKTWPAARSLFGGIAGYSDLTEAPDGTLLCVCEHSKPGQDKTARQYTPTKITLVRFTLDWLAKGDPIGKPVAMP